MKKLLMLLFIAASFAACNEPSGDKAGNDTGTDTHNNMPADTVHTDTSQVAH